MSSLVEILRFELRFRLRQTSTYLFWLVLFTLALLFISTDVVQIGGGAGRVQGNAPYVIAVAGTILTAFGAVIASATMGTAIYRDFEANAHELFFTTRISKPAYLFGRFLGAFLVTLIVFTGIPIGFMAGTVAPWADKASFGAFRPEAYLSFVEFYLIPNLFFIGTLFFVFGALTRSLLAIYAQGVLLLVGWGIAQGLLSSLENRAIAAYLDPFGLAATSLTIRYWTLDERNASLIPASGPILGNRLLWLAITAVIFAIGYHLFKFSRNPLTWKRAKAQADQAKLATAKPIAPVTVTLQPGSFGSVFLRLTGFYFRDIVRGVAFLVITLAGMLMLLVGAFNADKIFDTTVYPVTRVMVDIVTGTFMLFFLILITFYAGELTWRERVLRLDQVTDSQPIPTAATLLAKTTAVVLMLAVLNVVLIFTGVLVQAIKGYFHFELGVYFTYLFGTIFPQLICLTLLAFFIHALVNNKFLGHTCFILVYIATQALPSLGLQRHLYLFATTPTVQYSDMNGFGPFLGPVLWWTAYWLAFSILLLIAAQKMWVRGTELSLKTRWNRGKIGSVSTAVAALASLAFVGIGAFTYYNTDVLNHYRNSKAETKLRATYEKTYKAAWEKKPMPRITAVRIDADLHPENLQYTINGTYRLKNKHTAPISEVALQLDPDLTVKRLAFGVSATPGITDKKTGFRTFTLAKPLLPGAETSLDFDLAYDKRGFPNDGIQTAIAGNGTFLTMPGPQIGYQPDGEIADETERRKQKLPKRPRMAPATDLVARGNTYISNDSDWIDFEATVRTAPDQIALAPGYLQREWTEKGRHCFHYKMDAPIRNFYSILSARYAVKRDTWTSRDGKKVALEIYYHPAHTYNLNRMMDGMKDALAYDSANYSPYQFRQLRILEFPAYAQFAQSFPNTVPYSESIGFIARVNDDDEDIDYPYYVTAHEVSHQWWAHQVLGGNVAGSEMLSESLAEYSSLMILQHKYGLNRIYRFLRYDLDRYLSGRGGEREEENPLVSVQHQQYIHYPKGALAFHALADRIGEERVNATLSRFVKDKGFQEPPYTTAPELLAYMHKDTPPDAQGFLRDLFEKITLYDCRAVSAKSQKLPNGKWRVTVAVSAAKRYSNGNGKEAAAPLDDVFDIGVFAKPTTKKRDKDTLGKSLAFQSQKLTKEANTFTFDVSEEPYKAGIDPYNKLIDRVPKDNVISVESSGEPPRP